jgi:hypothetical protein
MIQLPNLPKPSGGTFNFGPAQIGYYFRISLASGSSAIPPANNTWQSGNFAGAIGMSNFAASPVNSTFDIAFVQHEPGPLCSTPMDLDFASNLDRCLRYFQKTYNYGVAPGTVTNAGSLWVPAFASLSVYTPIVFKKIMAKQPTVTTPYSPSTGASGMIRDATASADKAATVLSGGDACIGGWTVTSPNAANYIAQFHYIVDTGW